jgi:hypothetical protein
MQQLDCSFLGRFVSSAVPQGGLINAMRFWSWLLARLIAIVVLLGIALWYRLPTSGRSEFHHTLEALKKVNSIHHSMVADVPGQHTEMEADLVCSDDSFHRTTHIVLHRPDKDLNVDNEILRSGGQDYRLLNNGLWKREYSGLESAQMTCQRLAQGSHAWIVPDLSEMLQFDTIEEGDKKAVNGDVCREWKVSARNGVGYEKRTLCIGVKDHLPREMVEIASGARWTYAFDTSTKIEAPTAVVPEPVQDNYQPPPPGLTLSDDKDDKD